MSSKHFPDDVFFGPDAGDTLPEIEQAGSVQLASLWDDGNPPAESLPSDAEFMQDDTRGLGDLGEIMTAGVQNLDWLDVTEQDVERLPKNTETGTVIPELEEAWGVELQAGARHHALDREALAYQASLEREPEQKRMAKSEVQWVVQRALRRSAAGHPLKAILVEAAKAMGSEASRIRSAMEWVQREHGLAGRVFLRADAYPGCDQGKWKKEIPKLASGSKYLVSKSRCKGCIHNSQGSCGVFAKRLVSEVPWAEARELYAPILEATGRTVGEGDPRAALKTAFLAPVRPVKADTSHLPVHTSPSQRVTAEEAREALANAPKPERLVIDDQVLVLAAKRRMAQLKIAGWVKANLLLETVGTRLVKSDLEGAEMLRQAAAIITRPVEAAAFSGMENDTRVKPASEEAAKAAMAKASAEPKPEPISIAHREPAERRKAAQQQLVAWHRKGWLTKEACTRLVKSSADPRFVLKAGAMMITRSTGSNPYTGQPNEHKHKLASPDQVWMALHRAEQEAKAAQAKVDATVQQREVETTREYRLDRALQARVTQVERAIKRGVKGQALRNLIVRTIPRDKVAEVMPILDPLLKKTAALENTVPTKVAYKGTKYRVNQPSGKPKVASAAEVKDLIQWTRRQLHSGICGHVLNQRIKNRFGDHVIKAALPELKQLRAALEPKARQRQAAQLKEIEITLNAPSYDPGEFRLGREAEMDNIPMDDDRKFEALTEISFGGMEW